MVASVLPPRWILLSESLLIITASTRVGICTGPSREAGERTLSGVGRPSCVDRHQVRAQSYDGATEARYVSF